MGSACSTPTTSGSPHVIALRDDEGGVTAQGKGVASALVHAAEHRLATACTEIQMEYSYSFGDEDSARLCEWYEGRLGFRCANGCEPYDGENQPQGEIGDGEFRMCRKLIPEAAQRAGERRRLEEIRTWLGEQLQQIEAREALEQPMQMGEPTAVGSEESEEDSEDMEDDLETSEQPMQMGEPTAVGSEESEEDEYEDSELEEEMLEDMLDDELNSKEQESADNPST